MDKQKLWDTAVAHNGLDVVGWDKAPMITIENPDELESLMAAIQPAAAPQVVADERKGSPYPDYDRGFSNGWDACAKRAAAPVQAQELSDATIINAANKYGISPHAAMPFVRELIAAQSTTQEIRAVANPVEFDGIKTHAVRAQEPIGYASSNELRNLSDPGTSRLIAICASPVQPDVTVALYSAPAQPVAVPDGPYTFPIGEDGEYMILDKDGQQVGTVLYYHTAKVIAAALAAPAAQGEAKDALANAQDTKDAERYRWLRAIGKDQQHVISFYAMGEMDKRIDAAIAAKAAS